MAPPADTVGCIFHVYRESVFSPGRGSIALQPTCKREARRACLFNEPQQLMAEIASEIQKVIVESSLLQGNRRVAAVNKDWHAIALDWLETVESAWWQHRLCSEGFGMPWAEVGHGTIPALMTTQQTPSILLARFRAFNYPLYGKSVPVEKNDFIRTLGTFDGSSSWLTSPVSRESV